MTEQALLRLEGVVENVVYRNEDNGYTVLELSDGDDYITAVGIMPQVSAGDSVASTAHTADSFRQRSARYAVPPKARISCAIFPRAQSGE